MVLGILAVTALAYALDLLVFHVRVARNWNPYGSVTVDHYYAAHLKNGKDEYFFDPPQVQTCSHTLFPQAGYQPCWYLSRHPEQKTNV
jgi:hypothetical protein